MLQNLADANFKSHWYLNLCTACHTRSLKKETIHLRRHSFLQSASLSVLCCATARWSLSSTSWNIVVKAFVKRHRLETEERFASRILHSRCWSPNNKFIFYYALLLFLSTCVANASNKFVFQLHEHFSFFFLSRFGKQINLETIKTQFYLPSDFRLSPVPALLFQTNEFLLVFNGRDSINSVCHRSRNLMGETRQ